MPQPVDPSDLPHGTAKPLAEWEIDILQQTEPTRRRHWAAALRYGRNDVADAGWPNAANLLDDLAGNVEHGYLTPWADTPEPATPPTQPAHTAPAGDDGHPGTPDGPAVLGRAWLRPASDVPRLLAASVADVAESTEVLVVRPEVGRVLELLREWREAHRNGRTGMIANAVRSLAAGWDALDQPDPQRNLAPPADAPTEPAEPLARPTGAPIPPMDLSDAERKAFAAEVERRGSPCWVPGAHGQRVCARELGTVPCDECPSPSGRTGGGKPAEAAPEPAGDGPGWLPGLGGESPAEANRRAQEHHQLTMSHDRLARRNTELVDERDSARAELADALEANRRYAADEQPELDRLRADHLLIPKAGIVGYRVLAADGSIMVDPADVDIVLRGDLGQESDRG